MTRDTVSLTAGSLAGIEKTIARMEALGMVGHDCMNDKGEIVWCICKRCAKKRVDLAVR